MALQVFDLTGRRAVVVGGGSGIGRACALQLASAGAVVAVADVDGHAAEAVATEISATGGEASCLRVDVTSERSVDDAHAGLAAAGGLHIAVNCAGIGSPRAPLADVSLADWDRVLAVNLTGVFLSLRAQVRAMAASGGGSIITIGSVLSAVASRTGASPYVAAKHGMLGLTRQAAVDHAADGVRVNAVLPGYVATPLVTTMLTAEQQVGRAAAHLLGRLARPEEVAATVSWLAGDAASFVTGAAISVDVGYLAV